MTGEQLRDALGRVAERAPDVNVPEDLFDRGRRATGRGRALVATAAVTLIALVALVALVGLTVGGPDEAPVADGGAAGVPDVIHAPPDGEVDLPVTPHDEVGRAAAAYLVEGVAARVVVVTVEGEYLVVRLPDLYEPVMNDVSPLLSPDGTLLAYSTRDGDTRSRGLALLDLTTGETRQVALRARRGASVRTLQWSPDSRRLAWSGQPVTRATDNGASYGNRIIGGVVAWDASTSRTLPRLRGGLDGVGACSDGSAVQYLSPAFFVSDGGPPVRYESWRDVVAAHVQCSAPWSFASHEDGTDRVLGWLPSDDASRPTAVVLRPDLDDDGGYDSYSLHLAGPDAPGAAVGSVDAVGLANLSVATGLMRADEPTVPAGPSPWDEPWSTERKVAVVGGLALALLLAAVLLVLLVRSLRRRG